MECLQAGRYQAIWGRTVRIKRWRSGSVWGKMDWSQLVDQALSFTASPLFVLTMAKVGPWTTQSLSCGSGWHGSFCFDIHPLFIVLWWYGFCCKIKALRSSLHLAHLLFSNRDVVVSIAYLSHPHCLVLVEHGRYRRHFMVFSPPLSGTGWTWVLQKAFHSFLSATVWYWLNMHVILLLLENH